MNDTDFPKTRWTSERIARLGFLIGLGWDSDHISKDPIIKTTAHNVHRQADRFGLRFREVPRSPLQLPPKIAAEYDKAAAKRGITREMLIRMLLIVAGEDTALIENILDDEA